MNANEPVWPPDFPVFMGRDTFGAGGRRIREMLAQSDRHTLADFAAMQTDVVDRFRQRRCCRRCWRSGGHAATADKALDLLRDWDGSAVMQSPAPLIFNAWMEAFYSAVLRHAGLTTGIGAPVSDFVASVLSPAGAHWCDGDCGPMLRDSLSEAVHELSARFGDDPAAWRWGDVHQAVFAHPILRTVPVAGDRLTTISCPARG